MTIIRAGFLASALALVVATIPAPADAYRLNEWRYESPCISHNDAMVAAALNEWSARTIIVNCGWSPEPDILVEVRDPWPHGGGIAAHAGPISRDGALVDQCLIAVPTWNRANLNLFVHEVGHCLGLSHSEKPGFAMSSGCGCPIGADDVAAIEAMYGPASPRDYRVTTHSPVSRD